MEIGQYGQYKGEWHIALEIRGNKVLIINEGGSRKQILQSNFNVRTGNLARKVYFDGVWYLVTKTNRIVSLLSNKFMNWHTTHPIRNRIINTRGIQMARSVLANHQYKLPIGL
jgi:hypothetical protein